jgi:hypothetical protein
MPGGEALKMADICRQIIEDADANKLNETRYITLLDDLSVDALTDMEEMRWMAKSIKDKHKTLEKRQDKVSSEESLETVLPPPDEVFFSLCFEGKTGKDRDGRKRSK